MAKDLRELARRWRTTSRDRAAKLGRELKEVPSIDDVHNYLLSLTLVCAYCGTDVALLRPSNRRALSLDHGQPLSRGGTAEIGNCKVCCGPCNRAKGEMTIEEFTDLLRLVRGWSDKGRSILVRLRLGFYR